MKKRITALFLALCLITVMSTSAFAREAGYIDGDSSVQSYIITVVVPTNIDFALDPSQVTFGDSQIAAVDIEFENESEFATLIAIYLDVVAGDDVTIVESNDIEDTYHELTATDKELSFGILAAAEYDDGEDEWVYDTENDKSIIEADDGELDFGFVVAGKKVTSDGTLAPDGDNDDDLSAAFQFYSIMNAYADWKDGDVSVSGVYLLAAVNSKSLSEGSVVFVEDTTNLIDLDETDLPAKPEPTASYGFIKGAGISSIVLGDTRNVAFDTYNNFKGSATLTLTKGDLEGKKIPFAFEDATVSSMFYWKTGATAVNVLSSMDVQADGIVFPAGKNWNSNHAVVGTFFISIVLSNGDYFGVNVVLVD